MHFHPLLYRKNIMFVDILYFLPQVSKPFFAMLRKWLFSGELYDPFSEFFVALDPELADMQYIQPSGLQGGILPTDDGLGAENDEFSSEHSGGLKIWEGKYVFRKEMLPAFVGEEFGRKVRDHSCKQV